MPVHEEYVPQEGPSPDAQQRQFRRNFLEEQFALHAPSNADATRGGDVFRRKRVTFIVPRSLCSVEFPEDFELTLAELSGQDEAEAAAKSRNGAELGLIMAMMSMHGVNGAPIGEIKREWLWNALGMGGRTLVVSAFHDHLGMAGNPEGKAMVEAAVLGARVG